MQPIAQRPLPSIQQIYRLVNQFPVEQQLTIAEHIKKQALAAKWQQLADSLPDSEPDITEEEVVQEVRSVRAERRAR